MWPGINGCLGRGFHSLSSHPTPDRWKCARLPADTNAISLLLTNLSPWGRYGASAPRWPTNFRICSSHITKWLFAMIITLCKYSRMSLFFFFFSIPSIYFLSFSIIKRWGERERTVGVWMHTHLGIWEDVACCFLPFLLILKGTDQVEIGHLKPVLRFDIIERYCECIVLDFHLRSTDNLKSLDI